MKRPVAWLVCAVLSVLASSAWAKEPKPEPPPPFRLTAEQEKNVDRVLERWEHWNAGVKTFQCRFKRWVYDVVFGPADQPKFVDLGTIKYAAPDHASYRIDTTERDGKEVPIEDDRAQHWVCDGKSIWQFEAQQKKIKETKLPPELPAGRLVDGPLSFYFPAAYLSKVVAYLQPGPLSPASPFPFAAKAKELKQQYYLREATPTDRPDQIWLEAYPRPKQFAAGMCQKMVLIFNSRDMSPFALRIVDPNGQNYKVYQFFDVVLNDPALVAANAFHPSVPSGWQMVPDDGPPARQTPPFARRPVGDGRR
jgi:TIGR03009 family protein